MPMHKSLRIIDEFKDVEAKVIKGGYCVGCGICAGVSDGLINIQLDDYGKYAPKLNTRSVAKNISIPITSSIKKICPFSESALNEDEISKEFLTSATKHNQYIGSFISISAGHVIENDFRVNGTSGGMTTWIASELFKNNMIDHVIHLKHAEKDSGSIFLYGISSNIDEIKSGSKTRYYPGEMSWIIHHISNNPGRYAIIGLPCFIKGIRLLSIESENIRDRIKYCISLVCGHLKSTSYAKYYAKFANINPENIQDIDFRFKEKYATSAKDYFIKIKSHENEKKIEKTLSNNTTYGSDWGYGFFKLKACDYCDDVLGETADISIGDAWLNKYSNDPRGTNLIVCRNEEIEKILLDGLREQRITFDFLSEDEAIKSQDAGFRHRRDGLAYRLFLQMNRGLWYPPKRVKQNSSLNLKSKVVYRLREIIRDKSHQYFLSASGKNFYFYFVCRMQILTFAYDFSRKILDSERIMRKFRKILASN